MESHVPLLYGVMIINRHFKMHAHIDVFKALIFYNVGLSISSKIYMPNNAKPQPRQYICFLSITNSRCRILNQLKFII